MGENWLVNCLYVLMDWRHKIIWFRLQVLQIRIGALYIRIEVLASLHLDSWVCDFFSWWLFFKVLTDLFLILLDVHKHFFDRIDILLVVHVCIDIGLGHEFGSISVVVWVMVFYKRLFTFWTLNSSSRSLSQFPYRYYFLLHFV